MCWLMATSTYGSGKRCQSSPQLCHLQYLCTVIFINFQLLSVYLMCLLIYCNAVSIQVKQRGQLFYNNIQLDKNQTATWYIHYSHLCQITQWFNKNCMLIVSYFVINATKDNNCTFMALTDKKQSNVNSWQNARIRSNGSNLQILWIPNGNK